MFPRHHIELTEEVVEAEVEAVMAAGNMDVEAVHEILMNWTPTTVADMMKVIRDDRDKGKVTERDTAGIRVSVPAPYLVVVLITEG